MRKRAFDICFSIFALLITAPIFLITGFLIFITTRHPKVIFAQERIGRNCKPFRCYKFRTMHLNAEERLQQILATDPAAKKEWEEKRKIKDDPRILLIGKFLRKTSLDELPQFWNVLKGDLSIVGPRPVMAEEIEKYFGARAKKIFSVRPGLTGIWQTSGRSRLSYASRIQLDELYVDSLSLRQDLKLILKTIPELIYSKDAY
jgi:exopolysaccharide production protein ExoY